MFLGSIKKSERQPLGNGGSILRVYLSVLLVAIAAIIVTASVYFDAPATQISDPSASGGATIAEEAAGRSDAELDEVGRLRAALAEGEARIENLETRLEELPGLRTAVEERDARIADLEAQLEELARLPAALEDREARIADLESRLDQATGQSAVKPIDEAPHPDDAPSQAPPDPSASPSLTPDYLVGRWGFTDRDIGCNSADYIAFHSQGTAVLYGEMEGRWVIENNTVMLDLTALGDVPAGGRRDIHFEMRVDDLTRDEFRATFTVIGETMATTAYRCR